MREVRATYKERDSWWTVLLVDPVAGPLVRVAVGHRWITPNRLTTAAFLLGVVAAGAFLAGSPAWLIVGMVCYHLSFVIDCMDGKIARLAGTGSVFGGWLDFVLDRLRVVGCVLALFAGQFLVTDRPVFLLAATLVVFLALFGYVNGSETDKARAKLGAAGRDEEALLDRAAGAAGGIAGRVRNALHRRRIRMNLVSGIEFEMAVLVVAPVLVALTGPYALLWVTLAAGTLLVGFELMLMYRFWLATVRARSAGTREAPPVPPAARPPADDDTRDGDHRR